MRIAANIISRENIAVNSEKFEQAVKSNLPKAKGKIKYCICPICKGLISINTHEFDSRFYAICYGCGTKVRG